MKKLAIFVSITIIIAWVSIWTITSIHFKQAVTNELNFHQICYENIKIRYSPFSIGVIINKPSYVRDDANVYSDDILIKTNFLNNCYTITLPKSINLYTTDKSLVVKLNDAMIVFKAKHSNVINLINNNKVNIESFKELFENTGEINVKMKGFEISDKEYGLLIKNKGWSLEAVKNKFKDKDIDANIKFTYDGSEYGDHVINLFKEVVVGDYNKPAVFLDIINSSLDFKQYNIKYLKRNILYTSIAKAIFNIYNDKAISDTRLNINFNILSDDLTSKINLDYNISTPVGSRITGQRTYTMKLDGKNKIYVNEDSNTTHQYDQKGVSSSLHLIYESLQEGTEFITNNKDKFDDDNDTYSMKFLTMPKEWFDEPTDILSDSSKFSVFYNIDYEMDLIASENAKTDFKINKGGIESDTCEIGLSGNGSFKNSESYLTELNDLEYDLNVNITNYKDIIQSIRDLLNKSISHFADEKNLLIYNSINSNQVDILIKDILQDFLVPDNQKDLNLKLKSTPQGLSINNQNASELFSKYKTSVVTTLI